MPMLFTYYSVTVYIRMILSRREGIKCPQWCTTRDCMSPKKSDNWTETLGQLFPLVTYTSDSIGLHLNVR